MVHLVIVCLKMARSGFGSGCPKETHLEFIGKNSYPGYHLGIRLVHLFQTLCRLEVFDWMKANDKTMEIRYNNFKWYKQ